MEVNFNVRNTHRLNLIFVELINGNLCCHFSRFNLFQFVNKM